MVQTVPEVYMWLVLLVWVSLLESLSIFDVEDVNQNVGVIVTFGGMMLKIFTHLVHEML